MAVELDQSMNPQNNRSRGIFQRSDMWGNPVALWGVGCLVFLFPVIGVLLSNLRMENSITEWLPANYPEIHVLEWFQSEFDDAETVTVSWDSSRLEDERVAQFASALRNAAKLPDSGILHVMTPHEILDLMSEGRVADEDALQAIRGVLKGKEDDSPVSVIVSVNEQAATATQIASLIRTIAVKVGIPESELRQAGGLVTRLSLNHGVRDMLWNAQAKNWWECYRVSPFGLSVFASAVLSWVLLKSLRIAAIVLFVSAYTAALTTSLIPLSGGALNMVLVVIPTLLFVLTLSGAIHFANYWQHAFKGDAAAAASEAYQQAASPCVLAVATTAIGMLSLLTSDLKPVRDFGIFSAIGVTVSLGLILFGLPCLLILWPKRISIAPEGQHRHWRSLGLFVTKHYRAVGLVCLTTSLFAMAGLSRFQTETKLIKFFGSRSRIHADFQFMEQNVCGLVPIEVLVVFDPERCEATTVMNRRLVVKSLQDRLVQNADISGSLSLADFFPQIAPPGAEAPFAAKARYNRTEDSIEDVIQATGDSQSELVRKVRKPLKPDSNERIPAVTEASEVWRIKTFASALTDRDYSELINEIVQSGEQQFGSTPGVQLVVTGTVPLFLRTQEAVLQSMINSFGMAFILIQIVLFIQLKGIRAGALAMLPNVLPVAFVFGVVAWLGIRIDIGSMVTASVALGIAIDGTVHLLNWFEQLIRQGMSRKEATIAALAHCGPPMASTSLIICVGLLMMVGADLLLVSRFGWLMAALVFAALIGDIIYLPAMLQGSLGRLIEARVRTSGNSHLPSNPAEEPSADHESSHPLEHAANGYLTTDVHQFPPSSHLHLTRSNQPDVGSDAAASRG